MLIFKKKSGKVYFGKQESLYAYLKDLDNYSCLLKVFSRERCFRRWFMSFNQCKWEGFSSGLSNLRHPKTSAERIMFLNSGTQFTNEITVLGSLSRHKSRENIKREIQKNSKK